MSDAERSEHPWLRRLPPVALAVLASPRLSAALTTAAIGTAAGAVAVRRLIDVPGLFGVLGAIVLLMALSFAARWREIELRGTLPISLMAFLGWATVSLLWSQYQWSTLGSLVYLAAYTLMALFIALSRDTIQILRSTGDVLRAVLGVSLGLEVFSGVLIDAPLPFLGIGGLVDDLGPITGIAGTRNLLGLFAIIGLITFGAEARTRSVPRITSWISASAAGLTILLTRSPIVYLVAVVVLVAAAAVAGLRRVRPERRQLWQFLVLAAAVAVLAVGWALRSRLVAVFNAGGELNWRLNIWQQVVVLRDQHGLEGWGWIGRWNRDLFPFSLVGTPRPERDAFSASNAYLDVWFQLGLIGLVLFVGMAGLAFVRSWLLAGRRRSIVYAWPAIVLVALLFSALAESTILVEFGWVMFVICCVKASQELSWRSALERPHAAPAPPA